MENLRSFEELKCWKEAVELRKRLKTFLEGLPKSEEYKLKDQIVRCLRSVTNNIAEGYGRFNFQENIQFCRISRGSLYEIIDHLIIAVEERYLQQVEFEIRKEHIIKCITILNGYIKYLSTAKASSK